MPTAHLRSAHRLGNGPAGLVRRALRSFAVASLTLALSLCFVTPSHAETDVCAPARELLGQHLPQRVIEYVDGLNAELPREAQACLGERALAAGDQADSATLVAKAKELSSQDKGIEAYRSATEAVALDAGNVEAMALVEQLRPSPSFLERVATGWDTFVKTPFAQFSSMALAVLTLFALLVLAARLLAFLWPDWKGTPRPRTSMQFLLGGLGLAAAASLLLVPMAAGVLLVGAEPGQVAARRVVLACLAVIALASIWLMARGLATRLRLAVQARKGGVDDSEGAGHVLAMLEQLGATPARGIERPVGPDVMALESALADVEGGAAKVIKSIFAALTGWTPWRVTVDEDAAGDVSVSMSRNGKSKGAAVIGADVLDPRGTGVEPDPHVFVAAFVLTTLAKSHGGFDGLAGATDWVALGWQYVAATADPARTDAQKAVTLLAPAVDRDPASWLAQVDLASRRWRESTTAPDLEHYRVWLTWALGHLPGAKEPVWLQSDLQTAPLRLRVLATRAAISVNHYFASDPKDRDLALSVLTDAITDFCQAVAKVAESNVKTRPLIDDAWLNGMKTRAAAMGAMLTAEQQDTAFANGPCSRDILSSWQQAPRSPAGHYAWACTWATFNILPGPVSDPAPGADTTQGQPLKPGDPVSELRHASADPELVKWMGIDPQLASLRETAAFDQFRPTPEKSLTAVQPFAAHKAELVASGLSTQSLANLEPAELQNWMPVTTGEANRLVAAANTVVSLTNQPELQGLALEIVSLLEARGVVTRAALERLSTDERNGLLGHLEKEARKFVASGKGDKVHDSLSSWLSSYAPTDKPDLHTISDPDGRAFGRSRRVWRVRRRVVDRRAGR